MDIERLEAEVAAWQPVHWDSMPDIELYMDQVVTYLQRQLSLFQGEGGGSLVTPSIINNYVKDALVPRPVNKRYAREQLASLIMACVLKRVMPMQQVKQLLGSKGSAGYASFCEGLKAALDGEAHRLGARGEEEPIALSLDCALRAAAACLMADRLLAAARPEQGEKAPK